LKDAQALDLQKAKREDASTTSHLTRGSSAATKKAAQVPTPQLQ